jgi:hypothetical protein
MKFVEVKGKEGSDAQEKGQDWAGSLNYQLKEGLHGAIPLNEILWGLVRS